MDKQRIEKIAVNREKSIEDMLPIATKCDLMLLKTIGKRILLLYYHRINRKER